MDGSNSTTTADIPNSVPTQFIAEPRDIAVDASHVLATRVTREDCDGEGVDVTAKVAALKGREAAVEEAIAQLQQLHDDTVGQWTEAEKNATAEMEKRNKEALEAAMNKANGGEAEPEAEEEPAAEPETTVSETRRKRAATVVWPTMSPSTRTRTFWTPGSPPRCGPSRPSAGQSRPRSSPSSIPRAFSSPVTTSFSSGSHG